MTNNPHHHWIAKNDYGITTHRCKCGAVKVRDVVYVSRKRRTK
jgi:hypothetical protein